MDNEIKSVFIIESDHYVEITYQEFKARYFSEELFRSRRFICVDKRLLEVSQKDYASHHRERERNRYLKKLDSDNGLISMEDMDDNEMVSSNASEDVAVYVEDICLKTRLRKCLSNLNTDDRFLIEAIFYYEMTERKVAELLHISQTAVHKRKQKILKKIKKNLEE